TSALPILAIGELGGSGGDFLYVGTERAIHKVNATTMALVSSTPLEIEDSGPRHLRIVDVTGDASNELVFHTLHGGLVVMDANLAVTHRLAEPGIIDYAVETDTPPIEKHTRPIWLHSQRGHVVKVVLGAGGGRLLGASAPVIGDPYGMVRLPSGRVLVLQTQSFEPNLVVVPPGDPDPPPFFFGFKLPEFSKDLGPELGNMTVHSERFVEQEDPLGFGLGDDIELLGSDVVVLHHDRLYRVTPGSLGELTGLVLPDFHAATYALDIAVGEIDPSSSGPEVVIATEGGQLVYFPVSHITSGVLPARTQVHEWTSGAVTATWGLAVDEAGGHLYGVDHVSRLWHIDLATGAVPHQEDLTLAQLPPARPLEKPLRGLGWIPPLENSLGPTPFRFMAPQAPTGSTQPPQWIQTSYTARDLGHWAAFPGAPAIPYLPVPPDFPQGYGGVSWSEARVELLFTKPSI